MQIFGNDRNTRGCFLVLQLNAADGRGAQLRLPSGDFLPETSYTYPLLVTNFQFTQAENVNYTKCFGDYVYTYAFGHDPHQSQLVIEFAGMLRGGTIGLGSTRGRSTSTTSTGIVTRFCSKYEQARVSRSLNMAKLYIMGQADVLKGFVVGMSSSTLNPETSLQMFSIMLQLPTVQGTSI
jgi:hypothetical protein